MSRDDREFDLRLSACACVLFSIHVHPLNVDGCDIPCIRPWVIKGGRPRVTRLGWQLANRQRGSFPGRGWGTSWMPTLESAADKIHDGCRVHGLLRGDVLHHEPNGPMLARVSAACKQKVEIVSGKRPRPGATVAKAPRLWLDPHLAFMPRTHPFATSPMGNPQSATMGCEYQEWPMGRLPLATAPSPEPGVSGVIRGAVGWIIRSP